MLPWPQASDEAGNESKESNTVSIITDTIIESNFTVIEDKTIGDLYIKSGTLDLNGKDLIVKGNVIQSGGTLYINGGQLMIDGDYRIQTENKSSDGTISYSRSNGYLRMINTDDYVKVGGDFVTQAYYSHDGYLTAGILEVKGDFIQRYGYYNNNFYATGTHTTVLSGTGLQTVNFERTESRFNILVITKSIDIGYRFNRTPVWNTLIEEPVDEESPTAPSNLEVTKVTETTVSLSWDESTDNVGVAGYDVYRDGIRVGSSTTTSFMDTGLSPDTGYAYFVVAYDIMRNQSESSNIVIAVTEKDTTAPTVPQNLRISSKTESSVTLVWTGSTDNVKLAGYKVFRNDEEVGFSNGTSFVDTEIFPGTYTYYVKAVDAYNNLSEQSNSVIYDNEPPVPPELYVVSKNTTQIVLKWLDSSDNIEVAGYELYRNGTRIKTQTATTYTDSGLLPNTEYTYYVIAYDTSGNRSEKSNELVVLTVIDTEPPAAPSNLNVSSKTAKTVSLTWRVPSDNVSVTGYEIYRDGVLVGTSATNSYKDENLETGKAYKYSVLAYDAAGNKSPLSEEITVIPLAPHITRVNPVNGQVIGGAKATSIYVYFANTQNALGPTAKFEYSEDGELWTGITGTVNGPYQDSSEVWHYIGWNLTIIPSGNYMVRCTVFDEAGASDSIIVSYQVDRTPPSAPGNLVVEGDSGVIRLTFDPCPEADIKCYKIYRAQGEDGTYSHIATITNLKNLNYTDNNVEPDKTYFYKVTACDRFDQESEYSNTAEAMAVKDSVPPVVIGIEPLSGTVIGRNTNITVRAEDNLKLLSITLQYSLDDGKTWTSAETIETNGTAVFRLGNIPVQEMVKIRAIARDSSGNESNGQPERTYTVDTQGPQKVTNVTATPSTTVITLRWNDVPDQDVSFFEVEWKDSEDGEFVYYGRTSTTLGMRIENLKPLTKYWFRVVAYDIFGNRGTESDVLMVQTTADISAPVINSIKPAPSRVRTSIPLSALVSDNVGVKYFRFQMSRNLKTWTDIKEFTLEHALPQASFSYNFAVSALEEGSCYIRGVATDESGNESSTTNTLIVEYIIDRTAPDVPKGFKLTPSMNQLTLTWNRGEDDLAYYRLYQADSENGSYSVIADRITNLGYHDRNVTYGKTYYYKLQAVDLAGNESGLTEAVSGELLVDTQPPVIYSMNCPAYNGTLPANPRISVFAGDNYKLSGITLEYKSANAGDEDWITIGTRTVNSTDYVYSVTWNTEGLSEDEYLLRAAAVDQAGNISEPLIGRFKLNLLPPEKPVLKAVPGGWKVSLSWTHGNDSDLAGFRIYRSTTPNGSFRMLRETTKTSFEDEMLTPGQTYYYKILALDIYGNSSWSNTEVAVPLSEDTFNPVANAGGNKLALVGMEVAFDGTMSTDNDRIERYHWDFGDGQESLLARPAHIYAAAGEYKVKLTVYDPAGNSAQDEITVQVKDFTKAGIIQVKVVDQDTGAPLGGANVFVHDPLGETYNTYADNDGIARIVCNPGICRISAYKKDYKPKSVEAEAIAGQTVNQTVGLPHGQLVVGNLTVRRMTFEELVDAGIDVNAPENQYVYRYNIAMSFGDISIEDNVMINGEGRIVGDYKPIRIKDEDGGKEYIVHVKPISHPKHPEVRPTIAYMVLPGGASWLKEFFEVELALENTADPEFIIDDSTAELKLPEGLELVPTNNTEKSLLVGLGSIAGGEKRNVKWIITSTKAGEYNLEAEFNGTLQPFGEPVKTIFRTSEPFCVWGTQALKMHIEADDWAIAGEEYLVKVGLENVSDIPVYSVKLLIGEGHNYKLRDNVLPYAEVKELMPGQTVWLEFFLIPDITGELNLEHSFTLSVGDAEIETEFRKIPSPLLVNAVADNFVQQPDGSYIFEVIAEIMNYKNYTAQNAYAQLNFDSSLGIELLEGSETQSIADYKAITRYNYPRTVRWKLKSKPGLDFNNCDLTVSAWADNAREKTVSVRKTCPPSIELVMPEYIVRTDEGYEGNPFNVTARITNNDTVRRYYSIYIRLPRQVENITQKDVFQMVAIDPGDTCEET
ncbi:MAG: PKD domain-containing protein [Clostridiaceae bacterium]|nr:PKD domain-containing protein [Clostridiaceae bacterium]